MLLYVFNVFVCNVVLIIWIAVSPKCVLFFWDTLVHNCTRLQKYPFLLFLLVWDLTVKGSSAMFFNVFVPMRLVSLGIIGLAVGAGGSVKITPFSPDLQTAMDDAMFTFPDSFELLFTSVPTFERSHANRMLQH